TEDSPLLLNIFHVGEDESNFYYSMEPADAVVNAEDYVPDTLARRLASGALSAETLIPVLRDILAAIRVLHEAGFTHRDIKPENILFINGKPKLADLGLLSPLSGTMTQLAGTLDFLPPEERSREQSPNSRDSRQRNDLYAFGKIIYCCITGNGADQFHRCRQISRSPCRTSYSSAGDKVVRQGAVQTAGAVAGCGRRLR
ncbi:MAG: protein kinase domain-containing protein, partial [Lentisphaeria bacterium]